MKFWLSYAVVLFLAFTVPGIIITATLAVVPWEPPPVEGWMSSTVFGVGMAAVIFDLWSQWLDGSRAES